MRKFNYPETMRECPIDLFGGSQIMVKGLANNFLKCFLIVKENEIGYEQLETLTRDMLILMQNNQNVQNLNDIRKNYFSIDISVGNTSIQVSVGDLFNKVKTTLEGFIKYRETYTKEYNKVIIIGGANISVYSITVKV